MQTEKTDVVIVGVGGTGGILAADLGKAGMKVIGLERGPRHVTADFAGQDELRYFQWRRGRVAARARARCPAAARARSPAPRSTGGFSVRARRVRERGRRGYLDVFAEAGGCGRPPSWAGSLAGAAGRGARVGSAGGSGRRRGPARAWRQRKTAQSMRPTRWSRPSVEAVASCLKRPRITRHFQQKSTVTTLSSLRRSSSRPRRPKSLRSRVRPIGSRATRPRSRSSSGAITRSVEA
jgi:choline dehydrogenase-like flavoprotein